MLEIKLFQISNKDSKCNKKKECKQPKNKEKKMKNIKK